MTIDEAIKKLRAATTADERDFPIILEDAMKLGIEALKRLKLGRTGVQRFAHSLLPGETKD